MLFTGIIEKKSIVFWITGLSGSGKTKIGHKIKNNIIKKYGPTILFSGDDIRNIFDFKKYSPQDRLKIVSRYCKLCHNLSNQKINDKYDLVLARHIVEHTFNLNKFLPIIRLSPSIKD